MCLTKVVKAQDIHEVASRIEYLERRARLETGKVRMPAQRSIARGLVNAVAIADASPRVIGLMFGAEDYALDIGLGARREREAAEMIYARSCIVNAAAAADILSIDGVFPILTIPTDCWPTFGRRGVSVSPPNPPSTPVRSTSSTGFFRRSRTRSNMRARSQPAFVQRKRAETPRWPSVGNSSTGRSCCGRSRSSNSSASRRSAMGTVREGSVGQFFEDFRVGDIYRSRLGRTITETDNIQFTMITNNTNQIHFNADYASRTEFKKPLVNSALTLSVVAGLGVSDLSENGFALGWDYIKLPNPVFPGDTLYSKSEVISVRESKSRPGQGVVKVHTRGVNQDEVVVIEYERSVMVWKKAMRPSSRFFPR